MVKILVLCTGNSCRSIMAEALLNHHSKGRILAKSAGSNPVGQVNPLTLEVLKKNNISIEGLYSKSWDVFETENFDIVITVCDNAAKEPCPLYLGKTLMTHWGLEDPAAFEGDEKQKEIEFQKAFNIIQSRILALLDIEFEKYSGAKLRAVFDEMGFQ